MYYIIIAIEMQTITTITPKFQVHIPAEIRRQAGITKHGSALIRIVGKTIVIEPIESDFLALAGTFKVKEPISAEQIRDHIQYE